MPIPDKPLGIDQLRTYRAAVRDVWDKQVAASSNSVSWDMIYNHNLKQLFRYAEERKPFIKRLNYEEKITTAFAPYDSVFFLKPSRNTFGMQDPLSTFVLLMSMSAHCLIFSLLNPDCFAKNLLSKQSCRICVLSA